MRARGGGVEAGSFLRSTQSSQREAGLEFADRFEPIPIKRLHEHLIDEVESAQELDEAIGIACLVLDHRDPPGLDGCQGLLQRWYPRALKLLVLPDPSVQPLELGKRGAQRWRSSQEWSVVRLRVLSWKHTRNAVQGLVEIEFNYRCSASDRCLKRR